jgi:hypothetical protein
MDRLVGGLARALGVPDRGHEAGLAAAGIVRRGPAAPEVVSTFEERNRARLRRAFERPARQLTPERAASLLGRPCTPEEAARIERHGSVDVEGVEVPA